MSVGHAALWYEDFQVGKRIVTQGRSITTIETTLWCMFTGDMHPFHVDELESTAGGLFGGRFPPGLMSVAIASGLWERLGLLAGTGLFIAEQSVRYRRPVLHGDTIHMELVVRERRPQPEKARGIVVLYYEILRSDGEVCVDGELSVAVSVRREGGHATYGVVNR